MDFVSIFETFSTFGKLLGIFQDFFKNSNLYTNPESFCFSFMYSLVQIIIVYVNIKTSSVPLQGI